jgi:hypothetical protein
MPSRHLSGSGCQKCGYEITALKATSNTQEFIAKAINKHGDKYNYSKVEYICSYDSVIIICKKHGEFLQKANAHLCGCGCQKCVNKTEGKLYIKLLPLCNSLITQYKNHFCVNKLNKQLPYDLYS